MGQWEGLGSCLGPAPQLGHVLAHMLLGLLGHLVHMPGHCSTLPCWKVYAESYIILQGRAPIVVRTWTCPDLDRGPGPFGVCPDLAPGPGGHFRKLGPCRGAARPWD